AMPDVDPELEAVLARALARVPEERFQTAQEMRDALTAFVKKSNAPDGELAAYMHEHFEEARRDLQRRIRKCVQAIEAAAGTPEGEDQSELTLLEVTGEDVPVLNSGPYGLDDGLDATEPGSRSARRKSVVATPRLPVMSTTPGKVE